MERRRKSKRKVPESGGSPDQTETTAADFSFVLSRVAVSQITRSVGFLSAELSALQTLTLVATKYLQRLAELAASFSNAANRTESNIFDVLNGLVDLSSYEGFPGASSLHDVDAHCLIKSGILRDLSDFVSSTPEIPFAKPVPRQNDDRSGGRICHAREESPPPPGNHVPDWLPSFPDASLCEERFVPQRRSELWENSAPVLNGYSGGEIPQTLSKSDCSTGTSGKIGGNLPRKREKVSFKIERMGGGMERRGGACKSEERLNQRWHNNGGEADGEPENKKKKKKKKKKS